MSQTRAILVSGPSAFGDALAEAIELPVERAGPGDVVPIAAGEAVERIVWIHVVPAGAGGDAFGEARALVESARAARGCAAAGAHGLTFVGVVPMPGMFVGPARLAADLVATAMSSLMRTEIADWSADGHRIAGIVYGGIEGVEQPGQRPPEEIRRRTPMTVLGSARDVGDAVRFVASARASYLTGAWLRVDGGCAAYSWVYPTRTI